MNTELFLPGAIGAIAPEIVRLYEIRHDRKRRFSNFYFIVSALYVALGGYIASIFPGIGSPILACAVGAGLVLVVNKLIHIGGLLAEGLGRLVGPPPKADEGEDRSSNGPGFGHREATRVQASARQGTFIEFTGKL